MSETPGARVLIVDDDTDTVDTLVMLLEQDGHDCAAAYTGVAALRSCAAEIFDCMILDHQLGEVNGLSVAQQLSASSDRPHDVILLTGDPPDNFEAALASGIIDDHVQKPPDLPYLLARVRRSLAARGTLGG